MMGRSTGLFLLACALSAGCARYLSDGRGEGGERDLGADVSPTNIDGRPVDSLAGDAASDGDVDGAASYGVPGVEAPTNWPGRRFDFGRARASDGSFWIFGGEGRGETSEWVLADLWRFRPSSGQWTFVVGSKTTGTRGVYVSLGTPDPLAMPGGRTSARLAIDATGDVWLFGGFGPIDPGDHSLNDLWRYQPTTGSWTWMGGSDVGDQPGEYNTQPLWPGARDGHALSVAGGQLLLFGGRGRDGVDARGLLNDLWVLAR